MLMPNAAFAFTGAEIDPLEDRPFFDIPELANDDEGQDDGNLADQGSRC